MKGREAMKRLFAILLTTALLLGSAGCKSSTPQFPDPDFEQLPMIPGKVHTDYSGIEIRIDSLNWQQQDGQTTLTVAWNNNTDLDAVYGAAYVIERLDGEEWVSCAKRESLSFIDIAYELNAGQTAEQSYNLTADYDVTTPGTYRFKTDCYVAENADKSTKCELIAEFTVGNIKCPDDSKQTASEVQYCAQYIRTDGYQEGAQFPRVQIIKSLQALKDYYTAHKEIFNLERREKVYADTSIGFLDACDQYDESFFKKNYLLFVLLEEGSGSVRHEVRNITQTSDNKLAISIDRKVPEVGTCDMAQWHIILEFSRENMVETPDDVQVYLDSCKQGTEVHAHSIATDAQTIEDPFVGYCGNTWTVLHIGDKEYAFMFGHSVTLTDILINLDYDPDKLCKCLPEYTVDTEFALGYGINLTQGYARCDKGQADLTQEQIDQITEIIEWAETTNCEYPLSS